MVSGMALETAVAAAAQALSRLAILARVEANDQHSARVKAAFAAFGWTVRRAREDASDTVAGAISAAMRGQKPTLILCDMAAAPACDAGAAPAASSARRAWLKRLRRHASAEAFAHALAGRMPHGLVGHGEPPSPMPRCTEAAVMTGIGRAAASAPGIVLIQASPLCTVAGVARHSGLIPVMPLCLSAVPLGLATLRQTAEANLRLIAVITEDEPGEAGGQRAGLRAMPNLTVFRPADAYESMACLSLALRRTEGPSALLVSAAESPPVSPHAGRHCHRGAYLLASPPVRDVTLIAAGPELSLVQAMAARLSARGVSAAIVSAPCWPLFLAQEAAYRREVLGVAPRVGVEAGSGFGWSALIGEDGLFLAPDGADAADQAGRLAACVLRWLHGRPAVLDNTPRLLESGVRFN